MDIKMSFKQTKQKNRYGRDFKNIFHGLKISKNMKIF